MHSFIKISLFAARDRIEITNPGTLISSKNVDRLIGTRTESRNEILAQAFRRYHICEVLFFATFFLRKLSKTVLRTIMTCFCINFGTELWHFSSNRTLPKLPFSAGAE